MRRRFPTMGGSRASPLRRPRTRTARARGRAGRRRTFSSRPSSSAASSAPTSTSPADPREPKGPPMNARISPRLCAALALFALSASVGRAAGASKVEKLPFGVADGRAVDLYVLTDSGGMVAKVITYGATLTELDTPDRNGNMDDVVLGFDSIDGYLQKEPYFGAIVGRVGNRIAKGRFTLNGQTYQLATNDGPNHLHGGNKGFDKVIWSAEAVPGDTPAVRLTYVSKDGEDGYPGNCTVTVTYSIANGNELKIDY